MDNGFGTNLEGFLIHGNLSLNPSLIPVVDGDGSLEASGTFYIDKIREYNVSNGINIQHVVFNNDYVEIPFNNPSDASTGTLLLNGGITITNTTDSISLTSGGTLTTLGGVSIAKKLNIGDIINCNNNKIINLDWPTHPLDAANKAYVDSITFGSLNGNFSSGQVLIGGSGGNVVGFPEFTYNSSDGLVIYNTLDSISLSSGGAMAIYGGVNIYKSLFVGGTINVNNNFIHDVLTPILPNDAVNKAYVDNAITNITSANIYGNFSSGQILIGSIGNTLIGKNSFIFTEDYGIFILNTTDASGLGTGGALTITGGLSVDKHVFIGLGLDMNLTNIKNLKTPIDGNDAVNKNYIDAVIVNLPTVIYKLQENNYVNTLLLNNNQISPVDIPLLNESADKTLCFITYIYINVNYGNNNYTSCLYTIICFYNNATNNWIYKTHFSGSLTGVNFVVVAEGINVKIQYTNSDLNNTTTIQYYIDENIVVNPHTTQYNYTLPDTLIDEYHDFLNYLYTDIASVKLHVFITTTTSSSLYIFDLLFKENTWVLNYERVGPDLGIVFRIINANSLGTIQYTYTSNDGSGFVARVKQYKILQSFYSLQLQNNAYDAILEQVNVTAEFVQMYIYVEKPTIHEYAYYTIQGFLYNTNWFASSSFIGDTTDILFSIDGDGYLKYVNPDPINPTYIKIYMILPNIHIPTDVIDGGTGHTYLEPYSVLVGNGYGPILNTTEFIYQDCALKLKCPAAQIIVYNTTDATGLGTGGNLTLYGGASIGKSLYVGDNLNVGNSIIVNNINLTPSVGDLNENIFYANNNQIIPVNIPNFKFDTAIVKSFVAQISITIKLTTNELDSLVILKGISTHDGWKLMLEFIGDNTGVIFYCNNLGNIQYTSLNFNNWMFTKISFRATTTTV